MENRICRECKLTYPLTKDYFGHTPSGNFRYVCRQCIRKKVADHTKQHPEMAELRSKKRINGLQNQNRIKISPQEVLALRQRLKDRCVYCGLNLNGGGELEHMTPISRGGENNLRNITLSCYRCNKEKHNKTLDEYLAWRSKLGYPINPDLKRKS